MVSPPRNKTSPALSGQTVPLEQYEALLSKYESTQKEYEACILRLGKASIKLREFKKTVKAWQDYVDRHPKYAAGDSVNSRGKRSSQNMQSPLPPGHEALTSGSGDSTPTLPRLAAPISAGAGAYAIVAQRGLRRISTYTRSAPPQSVGVQREANSFGFDADDSRGSSKSNRNLSSQTTEGEPDVLRSDDFFIKAEPQEDDEPIVVTARTVKRARESPRSRNTGSRFGSRGQGTPMVPFNIKQESTDSVGDFVAPPPLFRSQTSDLDTLVGHVETPRKRQKVQSLSDEMLRQYKQTGKLRDLAPEEVWRKPNELDRDTVTSAQIPAQENRPPEDSRPSEREHDRGAASRDDQVSFKKADHLTTTSTPQSDKSQASQPHSQSSGPLQPLSSNLSQRSTPNSKPASGKRSGRGSSNIHIITEDGSGATKASKPEKRKAEILDSLLEGKTSPEPRQVLSPRPPTTARRLPRTNLNDAKQAASPNMQAPTTTRQPRPSHSANQSPTSATTTTTALRRSTRTNPSRATVPTKNTHEDDYTPAPDARPEHEPLRARPITRLSLDDFKINPAHAGSDYAFVEPARRRDVRRCLPGCTRECCSALRFFAEEVIGNNNNNNNANDNSRRRKIKTEVSDDDDNSKAAAAAKEAARHASATRVQQFADRFGKHRQRFERRTTPPGFWRTEMASTQEEAADRAEAKRMEREEVERRWRDAVAGGRRWVFRDE